MVDDHYPILTVMVQAGNLHKALSLSYLFMMVVVKVAVLIMKNNVDNVCNSLQSLSARN